MAELAVDVTVIVAVRNGAATLAECIDSVLRQEGCTVELIIVDAMSDDGTQEIVESYGDRIATYIREPDRGIYDAWNKALAVTRGEWCAFLGADDYFLSKTSLRSLLACAHQESVAPAFVYGGVRRVGGESDILNHPNPSNVLAFLQSGRMLPHPGSLHNCSLLRDIGGFDDSLRIVGDFVAVLALSQRGTVQRCPTVVTAMRLGGISDRWETKKVLSSEKIAALRKEFGILSAVRRYIFFRVPQVLGRYFERTALLLLGKTNGRKFVLLLRKILKRPAKFI